MNFLKDLIYKVIIGVIALFVIRSIDGIDTIFGANFSKIWKDIIIVTIIVSIFLLYSLGNLIYAKWLIKTKLGIKMYWDELDSKFPKIKKIGIVGIAQVGKTTLIEHLCRKKTTNTTTGGEPCAYIYNFSSISNKYAALLDGEGQSAARQNAISIESNFLLVLFDHNIKFGSTNTEIDEDRIGDHQHFLEQLIDVLDKSKKRPSWIHILLNKKDLWGQEQDMSKIINFYETAYVNLNKKFSDIEVTKDFHSNPWSDSITDILLMIENKLN